MPGYVEGDIHEYQQKIPTWPHHALHNNEQPDYGAKIQWVANKSYKIIFPPSDIKYIQKVIFNFFFIRYQMTPPCWYL